MEKFPLKINQVRKNIFLYQVFSYLLNPYYVHSTKLDPVKDKQIDYDSGELTIYKMNQINA